MLVVLGKNVLNYNTCNANEHIPCLCGLILTIWHALGVLALWVLLEIFAIFLQGMIFFIVPFRVRILEEKP